MRIIIEMTEAESRFATVSREIADQKITGQHAAQEVPAANGGPPPEALLLALGAKTEMPAERIASPDGATDAGEPPARLLSIVGSRGSAH